MSATNKQTASSSNTVNNIYRSSTSTTTTTTTKPPSLHHHHQIKEDIKYCCVFENWTKGKTTNSYNYDKYTQSQKFRDRILFPKYCVCKLAPPPIISRIAYLGKMEGQSGGLTRPFKNNFF